ncbi:uncharacterized protein LOC107723268 [Sinocyclocheilus rhinocerous]|uniref:uncharacterized protein LOC107723268 n=1 Tax=Sinocyclocheilus rhinocerous TaxID=307959 RepID=UPI0007BA093A|nr:PREDICTED: uncharacterized protein LOC107723268 [Sinocyclocheilus rhinocerous]
MQKNKSASVFLGTKCGRVERNSAENRETAGISIDASDGLDDADAISKTQNTDSSAAQTGDQGQNNVTQSTESCNASKHGNKTKCNSLQNGHIRSKSQNGDCTVIEAPPNPSTAAETESRASKTRTSAVRTRRTLWKSGSDQPNAAALECEHIVLQRCLPPPHPLANSSSVCVTWASARNASTEETSRQIHPTCTNTFIPRAAHASIQRSSRPSSTGHVSGLRVKPSRCVTLIHSALRSSTSSSSPSSSCSSRNCDPDSCLTRAALVTSCFAEEILAEMESQQAKRCDCGACYWAAVFCIGTDSTAPLLSWPVATWQL